MGIKSKPRPSIDSVNCLTIEEKQSFVKQAIAVIEEVRSSMTQPRVQVYITAAQHGKLSLVANKPREKKSMADIIEELNLVYCVEVEVPARIAKKK